MDKYGDIKVTIRTNNLGMIEHREYKWVGGPIVKISLRDISQDRMEFDGKKGILRFGPYKAKSLNSYITFVGDFVRMDYPFWFVVVFIYRASSSLVLAYHRLIITLAVWNLADFHNGWIPSYKDIHIIQKIQSWIKRIKHG